jgi:hypothetical protein
MTGDAPPRPDASAAWLRRSTPQRRWWPALAVAGVVLVTTIGGFVAAAALSVPAGPPVGVPGVVSVQPLSGWEPADPGTAAGRPFVRLTRGSGTLAVVAWGPFAGDAASLAAEMRDELLGESLERLSVSDQLTGVSLDDGTAGVRFTFVGIDADSGSAVEGEVTTVVSPEGQAVVFVGLAPEGLLAFVDGDLHTMVAAAVVGPPA